MILTLSSPDFYRKFDSAVSVAARGVSGQFVLMSEHENFMSALVDSVVVISLPYGKIENFSVSNAVIEVIKGECRITAGEICHFDCSDQKN